MSLSTPFFSIIDLGVIRSDHALRRFAIVCCERAAAAQELIDELHGVAIDVNHTFLVEMAEGSERFAELQQNGRIDQQEVDGLQVLRRSQ